MSEAERPDRLTRPVTVEDIRALAGPSTPHFALQIRNRIERLIEGLPEDDPVRQEGEIQIARLNELADGVWHIKCLPGLPWAVNAYLAGDILIDAGCRQSTGRILKQLDGHEVTTHALTHAHPDHQGASRDICEQLGIPFLCPELDVPAAEDPKLIDERQPDKFMAHFFWRIFHGPGHKVDRVIEDGEEVGGFRVIDAPGHSAGHVVFWRESDRVLILGDVLSNMDQYTGIPGLRLPKDALTPDPARNRESAKKLGALEPELVCFGHGAPLRDRKKFVDFVASLSER